MNKNIWVITMFDDYFDRFIDRGVIGAAFRDERASQLKLKFHSVSLPKFSKKGFKGVDASPFGGGNGMIIRPDVLKKALFEGVIRPGGYSETNFKEELHIVCPAPRGKSWDMKQAEKFAKDHFSKNATKDLVFICGRYEGIDERFLELYVDQFISVGDYILTGGELAVMMILDSSLRLSEGVLGNSLSAMDESFVHGKIEYALYTRPKDFEGISVPEDLVKGHHKKIEEYKKESSKEITQRFRPELLKKDGPGES